MILTIGKPAEFDENNLPRRGQCQPHTKGWRLRAVDKDFEEVLHTDTYYACRHIQTACAGRTLEKIRALAAQMGDHLSHDLQETAVMADDLDPNGQTPAAGLPAAGGGETGEDGTVRIPKEEMRRLLRNRKKDFGF